jgi:hypothetical protein
VIVVSDTSCINYLAQIGLHDVLPALFAEVVIPKAVATELAVGVAMHPSIALVLSEGWLRVLPVGGADRLDSLPNRIDAGESEAIALATKLGATLLIDDRPGRQLAESLGLGCLGTLGVLVLARRNGLTSPLKPILENLVGKLGFRATNQVIKDTLKSVGE